MKAVTEEKDPGLVSLFEGSGNSYEQDRDELLASLEVAATKATQRALEQAAPTAASARVAKSKGKLKVVSSVLPETIILDTNRMGLSQSDGRYIRREGWKVVSFKGFESGSAREAAGVSKGLDRFSRKDTGRMGKFSRKK